MPQLVPPHGSEIASSRCCCRRAERAEERKRAEKLRKISAQLTRGLRRVHAGHGGLYAARWVHGARRLARFVPGHETDQRRLLANPDHASRRQRPCRQHPCRRGGRARRRGDRRNTRRHGGSREIFDRQETRGRARLSHRRSEASGRREGAGAGGCQPGRAASRC